MMTTFEPAEIAHAQRRGYCLGCDHWSGPHRWRRWMLGAGHTEEQHRGVGPIGDDGLCRACRKLRKLG